MVAAAVQVSRRVDTVHEPVVTSPATIRRGLRSVFAQWGLPTEAAENALMVVEELVANAIDHARTPFRLTVGHLLRGTTSVRACVSRSATGVRSHCTSARSARRPAAAAACRSSTR